MKIEKIHLTHLFRSMEKVGIEIIKYIRDLVISLSVLALVHLVNIIILIFIILSNKSVNTVNSVAYIDSWITMIILLTFVGIVIFGISLLPIIQFFLNRINLKMPENTARLIVITLIIALSLSINLLIYANHEYQVRYILENCGLDGCGDPHDNYIAPALEYWIYFIVAILNLIFYISYCRIIFNSSYKKCVNKLDFLF